MDLALDHHIQMPSKYYFEEGNAEFVQNCKNVFATLRKVSSSDFNDFLKDSTALPSHKLFGKIKMHLDQVMRFYIGQENDLVLSFLRHLFPSNPNPLRFLVLSSMSLFTARVYLHPSYLLPDPIQTTIDGYYNLVVDLKDNLVRIPLLADKDSAISLPPSLRFKGINPADELRMKEYVFETCPKIGRKNQFSSFISVLSGNKPLNGFMSSLKDSFCSFDMSFSTAICALSSHVNCRSVICSLINLLMCNSMFDYFLRIITVSSLRFIHSCPVYESIDLVCLTNIFISSSLDWAQSIHKKGSLPSLIIEICNSIMNEDIPQLSLYILKCALVISAYEDSKGIGTVSMFLEIVIKPFVIVSGLTDQFNNYKRWVLSGDSSSGKARDKIEETILWLLGRDVGVTLNPKFINTDIRALYRFIESNISEFLDLVIVLNERPKLEHPAMLFIKFTYEMSIKNDLIK